MKTTAKTKWPSVLIPWAFVLLWGLLIFCLSAQPAPQSGELSRGFTTVLLETLGKFLPISIEGGTIADTAAQLDHLVRKSAHACAYLILGILTSVAFIKTLRKGAHAFPSAFFFCLLYAGSDEFHQLFVPGRSGRIGDVLIDCSGALVGIGICVVLFLSVKRKKHRLVRK